MATAAGRIVGLVRFHKRRDGAATIYEIVTEPSSRRRGVAQRLVAAVVEECRRADVRLLRLSCPAELPANRFYEAVGFARTSPRSRPGKLRPLLEWQMPILPPRQMTFVASLSNAANDLRRVTISSGVSCRAIGMPSLAWIDQGRKTTAAAGDLHRSAGPHS